MRNDGYYYRNGGPRIIDPNERVRYIFDTRPGPHLSRSMRRKMRQKKKKKKEEKKKKDDKKGFKWNWKSVLLACLLFWCTIEQIGLGLFALGHVIHTAAWHTAMALFETLKVSNPF